MQIKKVFSKILAASLASALLISCVSAAAPQKTLSDAVSNKGKVTTTASATTGKKPKYVFMFIGDGMSYPQFQAASDYLGAVADQDNDDILDGNKLFPDGPIGNRLLHLGKCHALFQSEISGPGPKQLFHGPAAA